MVAFEFESMAAELKKRRGSLLPSKEKKKENDLVVKTNPLFGTGPQQHGTLKTTREYATISATNMKKSGSELVSLGAHLDNPANEVKPKHTFVSSFFFVSRDFNSHYLANPSLKFENKKNSTDDTVRLERRSSILRPVRTLRPPSLPRSALETSPSCDCRSRRARSRFLLHRHRRQLRVPGLRSHRCLLNHRRASLIPDPNRRPRQKTSQAPRMRTRPADKQMESEA